MSRIQNPLEAVYKFHWQRRTIKKTGLSCPYCKREIAIGEKVYVKHSRYLGKTIDFQCCKCRNA